MAAFTDMTRFGITKLNNGNYQLWKFKVEMLLSKDDLWEVVSNTKPEEEAEIPLNWDKRDRQAKATISLCVEDDQLVHIRKEETSQGMWLALQKLHEHSNMSSKLYLLRKIHEMKFKRGQDMQSHITCMLETVERIRGLGEDIKDSYVACMLLCSLPESYGTLITALEARPEADLTLEFVRGKLLDEFNRREESSKQQISGTESALKTLDDRDKPKRETRECFFCKKQGHLKRDCRSFKANKHRQRDSYRDSYQKSKSAVNNDEKPLERKFNIFKATNVNPTQGWYVDSGATSHMTNDREFFSVLNSNSERVYLADQSFITAEGSGEGFLTCTMTSGAPKKFLITDVLYVPKLEGSLLSVKKLTDRDYTVEFQGSICRIKYNQEILAEAEIKDSLYKLACKEKVNSVTQAPHENCVHKWHRRMGHRDPNAVKKLYTQHLADGIEISKCKALMKCECCIKGKMARLSFHSSTTKSKAPLELIHSDVCGPMKTQTPGGNRYLVTFIDDYSRYSSTFLMRQKSEVLEKFKEFAASVENKFNRKICALRSDNGGEYVGKDMSEFLKEKGIEHQCSVPYTPEQNGIAERKNRSLVEMAKCMLLDAKLNNKYWGEAIVTATYLQNRLPSKSIVTTPFELWHGTKPTVDHIRIFGSKVYCHIPKEKRSKWDDKAVEGILVGFGTTTKGYRILDPNTDKITMCRNVTFDERPFSSVLLEVTMGPTLPAEHDAEKTEENDEQNVFEIELNANNDDIIPRNLHKESEIINDEVVHRRSQRTNKGVPPLRLSYTARIEHIREPANWEEASNMPDRERKKWLAATDQEIESLNEHKTWDLTELPNGRKAIGSKWVFKAKFDKTGNAHRYKARLVAKGYSQKFGEDYDQTFAPVVKQETVRTLFCIAAAKGLLVQHFDVKTAFLYGDISEELYMEQPKGYVEKGKENLVCKLNHSIYGLKQSAHAWNQKVNEVLIKEGFTRSKADQGLYSRKENNNYWTYILLYVDDLLVCSAQQSVIELLQTRLSKHFEINDLGEASYYLGIQIERDEAGSFLLHQSTKIKHMLERFGMEDAKPAQTPMDPEYPKISEKDEKLPNNNKYREATGTLLYIATVTRPDVAAAVGILCRRVSEPTTRDWTAVKRVMRYLKGTSDKKLYLPVTKPELVGYVDSDWAGDIRDRKSTSGFLFQIGGGSVSWSSRKQTTVATSSTEAEYIAAAHASQEVIWLRQLLEDMGLTQEKPTPIFEDNQGCIKLTMSNKTNARTKHIDVKYHLLRDLQQQGKIDIQYCPTNEMLADMLTKPLGKIQLLHCLEKSNLSNGCGSRREGVLGERRLCSDRDVLQ